MRVCLACVPSPYMSRIFCGSWLMSKASLADVVVEGGVAVLISFHSLEDRLVKRAFHAEGWQPLTKKPVMASDEEQQQNARSRSAKLRAAQRVPLPGADE